MNVIIENLPAGLMLIVVGVIIFFAGGHILDQSFDVQKSFWGFEFSDATKNFHKKWGVRVISILTILFGILVIFGVIKE